MRWDTLSDTIVVPAKLYRIGDLIRHTPFSRQTIHNYTIMGLIREAEWTQGGHRLYDESVFEQLSAIMQLRKSKSLAEIRKILSQPKAVSDAPVEPTGRAPCTDRPDQPMQAGNSTEARASPSQGES